MSESSPVTITFDFHDTIARCDRWFQLEVRELVPAFLDWHAAWLGAARPDPALRDAGKVAYAELRAGIRESGVEQDAVSCLATILPRLGRDVTEAEIRAGVDELMLGTFGDDVVPMPGAVETIHWLADQGVRLGVVSSAVYTPFLHWTLDRFGIRSRFADILTSADAGYYKSDPAIYRLSAERLGTQPTRITHVGDSHGFDIESPRRIGVRTVWVQGTRPAPDEVLADLTLPDLVDAGPAILELARRGQSGG